MTIDAKALRDDAIRFLERAFRNVSYLPPFSEDDLQDVGQELARREAKATQELAELREGVRTLLETCEDRVTGVSGIALNTLATLLKDSTQ